MVGNTSRADAGGLGPPHQGPDSLLRTETGVEDDGEGLRGEVLGVSSGRRRPRGPYRPSWLWGLHWLALASLRNQADSLMVYRDSVEQGPERWYSLAGLVTMAERTGSSEALHRLQLRLFFQFAYASGLRAPAKCLGEKR